MKRRRADFYSRKSNILNRDRGSQHENPIKLTKNAPPEQHVLARLQFLRMRFPENICTFRQPRFLPPQPTSYNMKTSTTLIAYGLFLILAGLAGYLSNPEKAKTALISGGTFGLLQIVIGTLALKGWSAARWTGLGIAAFLTLVFTWRSSVSWMAVAAGDADKLFAASLISAMLAASLIAIFLLLKRKPAAG